MQSEPARTLDGSLVWRVTALYNLAFCMGAIETKTRFSGDVLVDIDFDGN